MGRKTVVPYLEAGLPLLRQESNLPPWLLPEDVQVAHQLGDEGILGLAEPLGLADGLASLLAKAPDPDAIPADAWQGAVRGWRPASRILPMALAFLRAWEKVRALRRQGKLGLDPGAVSRGLAVLFYAPFLVAGEELMKELALALGGTAEDPAGLMDLYTAAIARGEGDTIARVERCLQKYPPWIGWLEKVQEAALAFPFIPRAIGVRLPLDEEMIEVLATMLTEAVDADSKRNHPN